jgi:hypothetical protein
MFKVNNATWIYLIMFLYFRICTYYTKSEASSWVEDRCGWLLVPPPSPVTHPLPQPITGGHLPHQALLCDTFLPFFLVPDGTSFRPGW